MMMRCRHWNENPDTWSQKIPLSLSLSLSLLPMLQFSPRTASKSGMIEGFDKSLSTPNGSCGFTSPEIQIVICHSSHNWLTPFQNIPKSCGWLLLCVTQLGQNVRQWSRRLGSIPDRVIPKTQKIILDTALLNTQYNKVRIKDKVEQYRERSSALTNTAIGGGTFGSPSTKIVNFIFSGRFYSI